MNIAYAFAAAAVVAFLAVVLHRRGVRRWRGIADQWRETSTLWRDLARGRDPVAAPFALLGALAATADLDPRTVARVVATPHGAIFTAFVPGDDGKFRRTPAGDEPMRECVAVGWDSTVVQRWAVDPSTGASLIAVERERQVTDEGWSPAHDAEHGADELLRAARAYLTGQMWEWPWDTQSFKPIGAWTTEDDGAGAWQPAERDLVRAGALIAAAIDANLAQERAS